MVKRPKINFVQNISLDVLTDKNGATCYETSSTTYGCACLGGFYGTYCENSYTGPVNQNSCANNPCLNGGTCQTIDSSNLVCLCPSKLII